MRINIIEIKPGMAHVFGATLASANMRDARRRLTNSEPIDSILLFDFAGVLSVTPSYLKGTVLSLLPVQNSSAAKGDGVSGAITLYPAICNCSRDVATDVHEFLLGRGFPLLHLTKRRGNRLLAAKLCGSLDGILLKTLQDLSDKGSATAAQLAEDSDERITVNGWNNRLADLHRFGVVTRYRSGKFWVYAPFVERVTPWA